MGRTANRVDTPDSGTSPIMAPAPDPVGRSPSTGAGAALSEWHFATHVEELGARAIAVGQVVAHAGPLTGAVCARIERDAETVAILFVFPDATESVWYFVGGYGR